jgi:hypothetical protein
MKLLQNWDRLQLIFMTHLMSYLWLRDSLSSRLGSGIKKLLAVKWVRIFRRVIEQNKHLASLVNFMILGGQ